MPTADEVLARSKDTFAVSELAPALADVLEIKTDSASTKIYRALERGDVRGISYLGATRIPRPEAERILLGESL